jgi:hypothetical protein
MTMSRDNSLERLPHKVGSRALRALALRLEVRFWPIGEES